MAQYKEQSKSKRILTAVILLFAALFIGFAFALPTWLCIPFLLWCIVLYWRRKTIELGLVLVSLLMMFAILETGVRLFANDIFFREQEKWAVRGRFYPGVDDIIPIPYGDLVAMDPSVETALASPRSEVFVTDRDGFRNRQDYTNEPYVLIGDSFTLGTGNTQDDVLVSQLNSAFGQSFYSLGYPGDPISYEKNAIRFLKNKNPNVKFLWFVFEGNDFLKDSAVVKKGRTSTALEEMGRRITIREFPLLAPRFMTILFRRVEAQIERKIYPLVFTPPPSVEVYNVSGQPIGFLREYIQRTQAKNVIFNTIGDQGVMDRTACVFLIPTKYRVYKPLLPLDAPVIPEPSIGLLRLQEYFGSHHIPVVDLTPYLRAAAQNKIREGKTIFWRDDTHWNRDGVASILPAVQKCLQQDKVL